MATLGTKGFTTIVRDFSAAVQSASSVLVDFTIGSILRAVGEAMAGVALWLQGMILALLKATRAITSIGPDLDTWVGDFGVGRLPARFATGLVTFSRATTSIASLIPVGALVSTADNSQNFAVYADPANAAYWPPLGGYALPIGVSGLNVPVRAVNAGTQANAVAGAVSVLKTGISGVDSAANPAAFINGIDAESDAALRARFVLFINALAKATESAIGYAVTSLQQGLQYKVLQNQQYDGTPDNGFITVIVDDGSGAIPAPLLAACVTAVDGMRAAGVRAGTYAAVILSAKVSVVLAYQPGYYAPTVIAQVTAALGAYVNGVGLGNPVRYTKLEQAAYDASPGVENVVSVLLNDVSRDLIPTAKQTVKVSVMTVS